jgi:ATP-dependent DNA helicase RecG
VPVKSAAAGVAPPKFSITVTPGVGAKLAKLGIRRDFDLVLHLPLRYEDETHLCGIGDLRIGQNSHIEATVVQAQVQYRPRRTLVVQVADCSGSLHLRFLNFYGSQVKQLQPGTRLRIMGEVRQGFFGPEMVHPRYRAVSGDAPLPETLTPVYPTTAGLSQFALSRLIKAALEGCDLSDTLPERLLDRLALPAFANSVVTLHHPTPDMSQQALDSRTIPAWRRLKFDELLAQQLSMRLHYRERRARASPPLNQRGILASQLSHALPFRLTRAQQLAIDEISADLARPHPMQRLLQGDVGSGKTVVAAFACAQAIDNGYQAALMAPTEILAEQHFQKIEALLGPFGVRSAWLTGSLGKKQKQLAIDAVRDGVAQLVIGTHAMFQEYVQFKSLGLAVVDEQHRFGVAQRLALRMKGGAGGTAIEPHQLMMSATPIPRTLSMSYFADLDVSVLDELPPGRLPVITKLAADNRRGEVIERVREACRRGAQAYWVCPLIEESETLQLQTALDTYTSIQQTFPDLKVGLLHGRLPSTVKAEVMQAFKQGAVQLLVATTVIEVGMDVANASLMVLENAERLGLSQMHQLRGRVGRGAAQSLCILLYQNPLSELARKRLKIIFENSDGFEIARQDLLLRGPGEFLGARQSGAPMLRFADLEKDLDLLEKARTLAAQLTDAEPALVRKHLERWLSARHEYLSV